jgi:hypothetical protein
MRLMDTAIHNWFFGGDPFVIHLLVCASYMVLVDLGRNSGKGPVLERKPGRLFAMTAVYDFLRHGKPDLLTDSVALVPTITEGMLFDAIMSFERIFNGTTAYMRTFLAYCVLRPTSLYPKPREHADVFLPKGITVEEAALLGRIDFFTKLSEMFAAQ